METPQLSCRLPEKEKPTSLLLAAAAWEVLFPQVKREITSLNPLKLILLSTQELDRNNKSILTLKLGGSAFTNLS